MLSNACVPNLAHLALLSQCLEARVEDIVGEPDRGEGVQQPLVKVVRHSSSILDLWQRSNRIKSLKCNIYLLERTVSTNSKHLLSQFKNQ